MNVGMEKPKSLKALTSEEVLAEITTLIAEMDEDDFAYLQQVVNDRLYEWRIEVDKLKENGHRDDGSVVTDDDFRWFGWTTLALQRGEMLMKLLDSLRAKGIVAK